MLFLTSLLTFLFLHLSIGYFTRVHLTASFIWLESKSDTIMKAEAKYCTGTIDLTYKQAVVLSRGYKPAARLFIALFWPLYCFLVFTSLCMLCFYVTVKGSLAAMKFLGKFVK